MILRLTQKLGAKIKAGKLTELPLDENPYADWSGRLFTAARTQYILLSNTASLYSCVMFGAGVTDDSRFIERALRLAECMRSDRFDARYYCLPFGSGTCAGCMR
ncbi:MAG: hypothetical protein KDA61_20580 [Planctomycetales bacterium]|nr:hypothetical protein [Planctomycetales bacterium]